MDSKTKFEVMEIVETLKDDYDFKDGKYFAMWGDAPKLISQLRNLGPDAIGELDKILTEKSIVTMVSLDPNVNSIANLIKSDDAQSKYTIEHPIYMTKTGNIVCYDEEKWKLIIPLGLNCCYAREIVIKDLNQIDEKIRETMKEYPKWKIPTSSSELDQLMKLEHSKEIFGDWGNPIIINDIAYLFYKKSSKMWNLRIPDGEGERSVDVSEPPQGVSVADAILNTIASFGLSKITRR